MSATASRPWSARLRIEASASQVVAAAIVAAFLLAFLVVPVGRVFLTAFAAAEGGDTPFLKAKAVACRYYLDVMVPEALSLKGSAMAGADLLYALDAEELSA